MVSKAPLIVSPEKILAEFGGPDRFGGYIDYLLAENRKINLVSRETDAERLLILIADCLFQFSALCPIKVELGGLRILDVGSGGGLPGLALTLAGAGHVTLVERTGKKARFLERALTELNLSGTVLNADFSEAIARELPEVKQGFPLATLRWVALDKHLLDCFHQALDPGGSLVYYSPLNPELHPSAREWKVQSCDYRFVGDDRDQRSFTLLVKL